MKAEVKATDNFQCENHGAAKTIGSLIGSLIIRNVCEIFEIR